MKKIIAVSILAISVGFASQGFSATSSAKKAVEGKTAPQAEMKKDVKGTVFQGVIKNTPDGLSLITKDGAYVLSGGNFDDLIDQEVEILGKATTEDKVKKIQVAKVKAATK